MGRVRMLITSIGNICGNEMFDIIVLFVGGRCNPVIPSEVTHQVQEGTWKTKLKLIKTIQNFCLY